MPADPTLAATHATVVTEDQIDHLGHMNVRFYGLAARAGTDEVVRRLTGAAVGAGPRIEIPDVYTRHLREQLLGARLSVRSGVLEQGEGTLRLYHELVNDETGDLAASFVHRARVRDTDARGATWGPAGELMIDGIPERGRPRSIDLDVPWDAPTPPLEVLIERDLAIRRAREVHAEEVGPEGVVRPSDALMLIWGGEPLEPATWALLHPGPNGEMIGWASMENRVVLHRLPAAGDRIQSFAAVLAVADKTIHRILWVFDLDRGEPLCVFQVVDLAFDTVARRAVSIPDDLRAPTLAKLHEDLAPHRDG